jgi:hypothetical protein
VIAQAGMAKSLIWIRQRRQPALFAESVRLAHSRDGVWLLCNWNSWRARIAFRD